VWHVASLRQRTVKLLQASHNFPQVSRESAACRFFRAEVSSVLVDRDRSWLTGVRTTVDTP
jgi:hypothetical protein